MSDEFEHRALTVAGRVRQLLAEGPRPREQVIAETRSVVPMEKAVRYHERKQQSKNRDPSKIPLETREWQGARGVVVASIIRAKQSGWLREYEEGGVPYLALSEEIPATMSNISRGGKRCGRCLRPLGLAYRRVEGWLVRDEEGEEHITDQKSLSTWVCGSCKGILTVAGGLEGDAEQGGPEQMESAA